MGGVWAIRGRRTPSQTQKSAVIRLGHWGVVSLGVVCRGPLSQYGAYLWGFELGSVVCFGRFWVVCLVGGLYLGIPRVLRPLSP